MRQRSFWSKVVVAVSLVALSGGTLPTVRAADAVKILNVSYDPTRELYQELNEGFAKRWKAEHAQALTIEQSHGGSGKQARSVIDGLEADVVTLALASDIDALAERGIVARNWQTRLPHNSCPFSSTIVLVVRKGNPKGIRDFGDLARTGVSVITPNPKTSGGARWNYLAAWGWALRQPGGDEQKARELVRGIYANVPVLDTGARGSTVTFVERGIGDVLIAWENEALLATKKLAPGKFEIVMPSKSILAEPPVAWVDKVVQRRATAAVARAYLEFLYTPVAQEAAARHFYRPTDKEIAERVREQFPALATFTIEDFGGWPKAQAQHFGEGGIFDQIYQGAAR